MGELLLVQEVEEIGLVLILIAAETEVVAPGVLDQAGVVAGGDPPQAEGQGMIQKGAEFDFAVAEDVRIGGPVGLVLRQKSGKDAIPILSGEVDGTQGDAEPRRDRHRIPQVRRRRAVADRVVLLPILHEEPFHPIPLFKQEQGRHRGIHAPREADHDGAPGRVEGTWGWKLHRFI